MQIGTSFQSNALSLLRSANTGGVTAQTGQSSASVSGGHSHRSHGNGQDGDRVQSGEQSDAGRMQGRLQRLSVMLQKMTEQNPDAQGASYAAIVLGGPGGAVAVSSTPAASGSGAGDTLVIEAQSISDVTTSAGDDNVTLRGTTISGIYTGAGSDSLSIFGSVVSGIHTDQAGPENRPPPPPPPPPPEGGSAASSTVIGCSSGGGQGCG